MTALDEIRERAEAIRRHLADLDAADERLRRELAANADERRQGRILLAMADAELKKSEGRSR